MIGDDTPGGGRQPSWMQPPDISQPPPAGQSEWWPAGTAPPVQPMDAAARQRRAYADARNRAIKHQEQLSRLLGFGGIACLVVSVVVFFVANRTAAHGPPGVLTASRPIGALMDLGTGLVAVGFVMLVALLLLKIKWNSEARVSPDYMASQFGEYGRRGAQVTSRYGRVLTRRYRGALFGSPRSDRTGRYGTREDFVFDAEAAQALSSDGRPEDPPAP